MSSAPVSDIKIHAKLMHIAVKPLLLDPCVHTFKIKGFRFRCVKKHGKENANRSVNSSAASAYCMAKANYFPILFNPLSPLIFFQETLS